MNAGNEKRKIEKIALIERQGFNLLSAKYIAEAGAVGLKQRLLTCNYDGLGDGADLERHIEALDLIYLQWNVGQYSAAKAGRLKGDIIGPGRQQWLGVFSAGAGNSQPYEVGRLLAERDLCADESCAGLVAYRAEDGAVGVRGPGHRCVGQRRQEAKV